MADMESQESGECPKNLETVPDKDDDTNDEFTECDPPTLRLMQKRASMLTRGLHEIRGQIEDNGIMEKVADRRSSMTELQAKNLLLTNEVQELKAEIAEKDSRSIVQAAVQKSEDTIHSLKRQHSEEVFKLRKKLDEIASKMEQISRDHVAERQRTEDRIRELEDAVEISTKKASSLAAQLEASQQELETLRRRRDELEQKAALLKHETVTLKSRLARAESQTPEASYSGDEGEQADTAQSESAGGCEENREQLQCSDERSVAVHAQHTYGVHSTLGRRVFQQPCNTISWNAQYSQTPGHPPVFVAPPYAQSPASLGMRLTPPDVQPNYVHAGEVPMAPRSAKGVVWALSMSSKFDGFPNSYESLVNDEWGHPGAATNYDTLAWMQATFPHAVTVRRVVLSGSAYFSDDREQDNNSYHAGAKIERSDDGEYWTWAGVVPQLPDDKPAQVNVAANSVGRFWRISRADSLALGNIIFE